MEIEVAYAESVPRYVDLALFLCGEALRLIRGELRQHAAAAAPLYAWHLHKVCFLHVLPNDRDACADDSAGDGDASTGTTAGAVVGQSRCAGASSAAPSLVQLEETTWGVGPALSAQSSKEVSFRRAYAQLRRPCNVDSWIPADDTPHTRVTPTAVDTSTPEEVRNSHVAGQVHPRSPCGAAHGCSAAQVSQSSRRLCTTPADAGFSLLCDFLGTAARAGGTPLMQRLTAVLCSLVTPATHRRCAPDVYLAHVREPPSSSEVTVAQLSELFDDNLLDEELSTETGNATRSFHIWVNYEWASASFARQTRLATAVTKWMAALRRCLDGSPPGWLPAPAQLSAAFTPLPLIASAFPINVRRMQAVLEGVFEGHAGTRATLMELSLMQREPQLTDNALAKLLTLQGSPVSAMLTRSELSNRGTQPILMCITSGMLLYAQVYLSFHSLAVARQCARVALQVAQEVQSNTILALAHYTAHVVAAHQGRPADAANSISIALQLTLPNGSGRGSGQRGSPADEPLSSTAPTLSGADAQMVSLAFAGAAQLLLFFPGAVDSALRSVLSTGERSGGSGIRDDGAVEQPTRGAEDGRSEELHDAPVKQSGGVTTQTVAQSIRHALLRAHVALLQAAPVEGRWIGVVASLQRETLLLTGAIYGIVSSPLVITTTSLHQLLEEVKEETSTESPLYSHHPSCTLLWEVLRHAAHHALALQEGFLAPVKRAAKDVGGGSSASDALHCLHMSLTAIGDHYGTSASAAANEIVFFSSVVRYCAGCQLYEDGKVAAAYDVWSRVAGELDRSACTGDMDVGQSPPHRAEKNTADAPASENLLNTVGDTDGVHFWPPDHLLLYALVQRRRAQAAVFLDYIEVPHRLHKELLTISSRYAFAFGVLTAQLMQAQVHQHVGLFSASLNVARDVERAATRIGYPSLCEAARALQVTAYSSNGCWREAQRTLARCRPTTAAQRTFVMLQQYAVRVEPLLLQKSDSTEQVECLTRSWVALLMREGLVTAETAHGDGDLRVRATEFGISAVDELCLYSSLQRAYALIGCRTDAIERRTAHCLKTLSAQQQCPTPDVCIQGSCEEMCRGSLYGSRS